MERFVGKCHLHAFNFPNRRVIRYQFRLISWAKWTCNSTRRQNRQADDLPLQWFLMSTMASETTWEYSFNSLSGLTTKFNNYALLAICEANLPISGGFHCRRPVMWKTFSNHDTIIWKLNSCVQCICMITQRFTFHLEVYGQKLGTK